MIGGRLDAIPPIVLVLAAGLVHGLLLAFVPTGRFLKYTLAAERWLAGDMAIERWLDFSPLLFHLAVLAETVGDSLALLTWLQVVLVAVSVGLVYLLLEPYAGRRWALVGAAVLLLDRHLVVYGRLIEPEVWLLALVLAALVLAERGRPLATGVALALALAVRPSVLPLALLVPVWWWLRGRIGGESKQHALRTLLCWSPCLLVLFLMSWRTQTASGSWTAASMNPGTVFFEGHNPASRGVSAEYPPVVRALSDEWGKEPIPDPAHVLYRNVARADEPSLDGAGVNSYWSGKAVSFLRDEPGVAIRRAAAKLLYSVHSFPWHDVPQASLYELRLPWLPSVPFGVLSALALVGLATSIARWRDQWLLYALLAGQIGVMVLFYASARQRILTLPALIFFAVAGCKFLLDSSQEGRRRVLVAALVGVLSLALTLPTDTMRAERYELEAWVRLQAAQSRYLQLQASPATPDDAVQQARVALVVTAGRHLDRLGLHLADPRFEEANTYSAAAGFLTQLLESPELTDVQASKVGLDAAWLWLLADRPADALASLRPPVGDDRPAEAWLRGRALARSGQTSDALAWLDAALVEHPGYPELLAERIVLTPQELPGESDESRRLLARYWSSADGWWLLSRAYEAHGRDEEAHRLAGQLETHFPELKTGTKPRGTKP